MPTELETRKEQKRFLMTLMTLRLSLEKTLGSAKDLKELDQAIIDYSTEMYEEDVALVEKNSFDFKRRCWPAIV